MTTVLDLSAHSAIIPSLEVRCSQIREESLLALSLAPAVLLLRLPSVLHLLERLRRCHGTVPGEGSSLRHHGGLVTLRLILTRALPTWLEERRVLCRAHIRSLIKSTVPVE